jgi:hypothetical protein
VNVSLTPIPLVVRSCQECGDGGSAWRFPHFEAPSLWVRQWLAQKTRKILSDHPKPLSFIKTSYTRNINDLAASSIGNVPVRF